MKMLRYLFSLAFICCLTHVAHADNFQMVVVDPTVPVDVIQPVYTDNFTLNFPTSPPAAGCGAPGQLPSGLTDPQDYTACFTGVNLTGKPLTSLEIELPISIVGSSPSCPLLTQSDGGEFSNVTCTSTNGGLDELFDFTGGDIVNATIFNSFCFFNPTNGAECYSPAIFTIAIGIPGMDLSAPGGIASEIDAADITVVANSPEPSSILLMSTGVLSLGLFGAYRRQQILVAARPASAANLN